jgi:hypothetical protein
MFNFYLLVSSLRLFVFKFIKGQTFKGSAYCSLPLLILNYFTDIQLSDEKAALFHFSLSILIFSTALLGIIFNLFLTIGVLYYKNKFDLESKFKDYPFILKIIKFYEKASYVGIIYGIV